MYIADNYLGQGTFVNSQRKKICRLFERFRKAERRQDRLCADARKRHREMEHFYTLCRPIYGRVFHGFANIENKICVNSLTNISLKFIRAEKSVIFAANLKTLTRSLCLCKKV